MDKTTAISSGARISFSIVTAALTIIFFNRVAKLPLKTSLLGLGAFPITWVITKPPIQKNSDVHLSSPTSLEIILPEDEIHSDIEEDSEEEGDHPLYASIKKLGIIAEDWGPIAEELLDIETAHLNEPKIQQQASDIILKLHLKIRNRLPVLLRLNDIDYQGSNLPPIQFTSGELLDISLDLIKNRISETCTSFSKDGKIAWFKKEEAPKDCLEFELFTTN